MPETRDTKGQSRVASWVLAIGGAIGLSVACSADGTPTNAPASFRAHTVQFDYDGQTHSHDYVCTPTVFGKFTQGGGDPFSGGTGGQSRGVKTGLSPTPQFLAVAAGADQLLLRLACTGQWRGFDEISDPDGDTPPSDYMEVFRVGPVAGGAPSLQPLPDIALSVSAPRKPEGDVGAMMRAQIAALEPFHALIKKFKAAGLIDGTLFAAGGNVLIPPKDASLKYHKFSSPWIIECAGPLPLPTATRPNLPSPQTYAKHGQAVLSLTPELQNCTFLREMSRNSGNVPRTPFPEDVLHLITDDGEAIFLASRKLEMPNPYVLLHGPKEGLVRGYNKPDPFLASEFYMTELSDVMTAFPENLSVKRYEEGVARRAAERKAENERVKAGETWWMKDEAE